MDTKVLFSVTGIGQPHYDHKLEILQFNLNKLSQCGVSNYQIIISFYDESPIPEWLQKIGNVTVIREHNHVGSFIQKHLIPSKLDFDYIFMILDDVQLPENIDLMKMIKTYDNTYITNDKKKTLLSGTLSDDSIISHQYMKTQHNIMKNENVIYHLRKEVNCEYFFYLMNKRSWKRYYSIINSYPKYTERLWGVDLLLKKYKINAYLCDGIICKHYYSHGAGQFADLCVQQMKKLLKKSHPPHY